MPIISTALRERLGNGLIKAAVGLSLDQDEMAQRLAATPSKPAVDDITKRVMAVTGGLAAMALGLAARVLPRATPSRPRRPDPGHRRRNGNILR